MSGGALLAGLAGALTVLVLWPPRWSVAGVARPGGAPAGGHLRDGRRRRVVVLVGVLVGAAVGWWALDPTKGTP